MEQRKMNYNNLNNKKRTALDEQIERLVSSTADELNLTLDEGFFGSALDALGKVKSAGEKFGNAVGSSAGLIRTSTMLVKTPTQPGGRLEYMVLPDLKRGMPGHDAIIDKYISQGWKEVAENDSAVRSSVNVNNNPGIIKRGDGQKPQDPAVLNKYKQALTNASAKIKQLQADLNKRTLLLLPEEITGVGKVMAGYFGVKLKGAGTAAGTAAAAAGAGAGTAAGAGAAPVPPATFTFGSGGSSTTAPPPVDTGTAAAPPVAAPPVAAPPVAAPPVATGPATFTFGGGGGPAVNLMPRRTP